MADDKNNTEKRVAIIFAGVILVFAVIAIITVFALHNNADRKLFIGVIRVFIGIISLFASMAMYTSPMVAVKRKRETPSSPTATVNSTTSTSASASVTDLVGEYEVFLSFRGADNRNSFTDHLYTNLSGARVRTFRDDNELRVGEEIGPELLRAIKQSKISIPIFSKNYASSKWCLRELAHMVECRANGGQLIYPIFYDVEPNDVQHCERGSYKDAFLKHKKDKKLDEKTVQEWKAALEKVGDLKGLELKKVANGHQGEFVKIIVDKVLSKLKKNYKHVPENLVGMDGHIKEMERLINIDFDGVRIIGILGMGGLGKTTIAMVIYNQVCELFECHCFIGDVRENSNSVGIVKLQKRLVSQILKRESKFDDVHQGLNEIKGAVHRKKVLIVLDDVDKNFQIDELVGNPSWYGAGSRIIITTRNEDALLPLEITCQKKALHEIYRCYRPNLMDNDLALKLFSKRAFMVDSPPEDYDALAMDVVRYAGGLPLVLVTLGSLLFFETDKYLWQEKLKKLQALPPLEVLGRLRISYDALDNAQQQIFLDIACFFSGKDKTNPYYMWDDCKFYPGEGINALVRRSLITVGDDNKLWMHDRLRELGEQIICEKYQDEPEKWSRLWRSKDALDVLGKHLGTKNVKLLRLNPHYDPCYDQRRLRGEDFRKLPNLRYLSMNYVNLDGDFKNLLQNLRWLQWSWCLEESASTNLHLKNLVVLDISYSRIKDDWGVWSQIKMSNKLKVLNLSYSPGLTKIPHLSAFPTLERLYLLACSWLCRLDGLDELQSLKCLDASHCSFLESLPDLSKLTSLQTLNLKYCSKLTEIQGLSKLTSLQTLDVNSCVELTEIQGLDKLASIEFLDTTWCRALERLPNLSNLQKLTIFKFSHCVKLVEIQGLDILASLEHLDIEGCKSLKSLPDLSNLTNLKELNVSHCVKLTELRGLEELKFLKQLRIFGCMSLENLPNLPNTMIQKDSEDTKAFSYSQQNHHITYRVRNHHITYRVRDWIRARNKGWCWKRDCNRIWRYVMRGRRLLLSQ